MNDKRPTTVSASLIAGVLLFWLAVSTSAAAGEIFWRDDGTGWEYGRDTEGRPITTIHYRKDPYSWSTHQGGKEVRTYDPETGGIIHNEFFNDEGVHQWEETINPETGDTTATSYFDLNGNPKVTTKTYNNYWVKEAASQRRGEPQDGWIDQFTKDEGSLFDGFDEWTNNLDKGLQKLADQWKDFISGGSLGIKKQPIQDAPARPEESQPPEHSGLSSPSTPPATEPQPNGNNPMDSSSHATIGGSIDAGDGQLPLDGSTSSFGGSTSSGGGATGVFSLANPAGKKELTYEERQKAYDKMSEKYDREQREKAYDKMIEKYDREQREKRYDEMIEKYDREQREKAYDKMIKEYEEKQKSDSDQKQQGSLSSQVSNVSSAFTTFDSIQQGGLGTLSVPGNTTPTAALDATPQSRNMGTSTGVLVVNSNSKTETYKSDSSQQCEPK
ncbi:MAG: hypothetical protein A3C35_05330 [Omnitrophica bacterium RIFCSPHIGHO2_02_FULL_46_11]|nr:MAG: hypothetical protein A3C35_05330 [Omnitrophica bacterium RIFCSPHIGHO2_02_FULL_46_11]